MMRIPRIAIALMLVLAACHGDHMEQVCTTNADCPAGYVCNLRSNLCEYPSPPDLSVRPPDLSVRPPDLSGGPPDLSMPGSSTSYTLIISVNLIPSGTILSGSAYSYLPGTETETTTTVGNCTKSVVTFGANPIGTTVYAPFGTLRIDNPALSASPTGTMDSYYAQSSQTLAPGTLVNTSYDGAGAIAAGMASGTTGAPIALGGAVPSNVSKAAGISIPASGGQAGNMIIELQQSSAQSQLTVRCSAPANSTAFVIPSAMMTDFSTNMAILHLEQNVTVSFTATPYKGTFLLRHTVGGSISNDSQVTVTP